MKKTNRMASIEQLHPHTNTSVHFERRVYENENGIECVRINGFWFEVDWLITHNHNINFFKKGEGNMTRSERLFLENKVEVCGIIATIIKSIYGKDVYYMRTDFDCLCNGKTVEADLYLDRKTGRYLALIN